MWGKHRFSQPRQPLGVDRTANQIENGAAEGPQNRPKHQLQADNQNPISNVPWLTPSDFVTQSLPSAMRSHSSWLPARSADLRESFPPV
jgi:hypothetical protein